MVDTYNTYTVTTDFLPPSGISHAWSFNCATRLPGGRIFVVYAESTGRYIYARYSDDTGATWSAAETVFDAGGTGSLIRSVVVAQNYAGRVVCLVAGTASNQMLIKERSTPTGAGTWSTVYTLGSAYSGAGQEQTKIAGSYVGDYFFIGLPGTSGGGHSGYDQMTFYKLTPGAPWTNTAFTNVTNYRPSTVTNVGSQFSAYEQAFDFLVDSSDNIYWCHRNIGNLSSQARYSILTGKFTGCANPATAAVVAAEIPYDSGSTANAYAGGALHIILDTGTGRPVIYYAQQGPGTVFDVWVTSKTSGSWSALARVGSGAATVDGGYPPAVNLMGGVPTLFWGQPNLDSTTKWNMQRGTTGNTRSAISAQSTADIFPYSANMYEAANKYGQFSTGWMLFTSPVTGSPRTLSCRVSTSPVLLFDSAVQVYNKTISQTINFSQILATQGFIVRSLKSATITKIPGGGRQMVRTAAGAIWSVYYDGAVKTAYSTDNGTNWTEVSVGATWVPAGMCLAIGAGDQPILVLSRPSNDDFYIYQLVSGVWTLKKQLNCPTAQSESFQILYAQSTYFLISGYITSTSDRRVYAWTSANLTSWTSTLLHNGDSSGTGPQKYRRVAACVDANGYVHAVYSIRQGSTHTLYYRKYTASWGTEETIVAGYGGDNISDYQSGLSIAVDDLGYVHVAARVRGLTYTSRARLAYFKRTSSWAAAEAVVTETDADQDFPSLSLNLRTAVICWAKDGTTPTRAKRGSDGTWTTDVIGSNTRDTVQTVHGPSYGSTYNYTRGVVGSMRGSLEYFYSSDIISGNAASIETTINFTSILSTQRRVLANTINFASVLSAVRSLTLRNTINFTQRLNFARQRVLEGHTINFQSLLFGTTGQILRQNILFTSALSGVKTPNKALAHTINFTSSLVLTFNRALASAVTFNGVLSQNRIRKETLSQNIAFTSTLRMNGTLKKLLSGTLNFISRMVGMKGNEGCETHFTPERTLGTADYVYLIGPLPSLSLTVQVKKPEYGNTRRQSLQVKVNRTRGGKLRVHSRTPTYEPQEIHWAQLSYLKLDEVRNFVRVCKGFQVYYIDERNRKWKGYMTSSDIDLADQDFDRGGEFSIEFEGSLV